MSTQLQLVDRLNDRGTTVTEADVCIIGCGPAGITLARELVASGASVVAVESGRLEEDPSASALTEGRAWGPIIKDYETYLRDSRRFQVGGAAANWGFGARAWCIPFCSNDFERREWVDDSGWPFTASDLAPFAARAASAMGIRPFEASTRPPPKSVAKGDAKSLVSHTYHYPTDSSVFRNDFVKLSTSERFRAELGATAMDFAACNRRVESVRVVRADGEQVLVAAEVFVLASGGIENARILLLDQEDGPSQIMANRNVLGRYFMEHFHVYAGTVRFPNATAWRDYLQISLAASLGHCRLRILGLTEEVQRHKRLLNSSVQLALPDDVAVSGVVDSHHPVECELLVRSEQAPNIESRVLLDERRDRLGRRRAALHWSTSDQDWDSVVRSVSIVVSELKEAYDAEAELLISRDVPWPWAPASPAVSRRPTWGNHHIGTTRMDDDPGRGVVDSTCRVHGTSNLFVAGSSVFPTGSFANPTFTIVALAIRLADHINLTLATSGPRV